VKVQNGARVDAVALVALGLRAVALPRPEFVAPHRRAGSGGSFCGAAKAATRRVHRAS